MKYWKYITLLLLFPLFAQGQKSIQEYVEDGDKLMETGHFFAAVESYSNALRFDTTNARINYKKAQALSKSLNFCHAIRFYKSTMRHGDTASFPLAVYDLAVAQKNCGQYEASKQSLQLCLELSEKYASLSERHALLLHELASVEFALAHQNDSVLYEITHLPKQINTVNSEFNPVMLPGQHLVYSSYQTLFADSFSNIFSTFYTSKILESKLSKQGWSEAKSFDKRINSNRWFTANITFDKRYRTAYFSRCYDNNGRIGRCILYTSEWKNGKWQKPKKLPKPINSENSSSTQPFLVDGDDIDILYFVSNRKGGYGGYDIWYSIIKDGDYQAPSNLGKVINTQGDELTPFYDDQEKLLYFSSNWHQSFGGFDIFKSEGGLNQWSKVENMGIPINSENNDLYYTPLPFSQDAYFSSNRLGSYTQLGADYCCSDIYFVSGIELETEEQEKDTVVNHEITLEEKIQELLPIALYFDNDIPDPKSTSDSTHSSYPDLLAQYIKQKEIYKQKYAEGLSAEKQQAAEDSIEVFFNDYVQSGFGNLNKFLKLLRTELENGKTVSLVIKGFASPLNNSDYNYQLSKRRIASLINYLHTAQNGFFKPYLQQADSLTNRIIIYEDPRGDQQAKRYVSSNPNDKRNSVYSKSAALERRIQIVMYNSGDTLVNRDQLPKIVLESRLNLGEHAKKTKTIKGSFEIGNEGNTELKIKAFDNQKFNIQFQPEKLTIKPQEKAKIYYLLKTNELEKGKHQIKVKVKSNLEKEHFFMMEFILN